MSSDIALKGEDVLFILICEILFEFISDTYAPLGEGFRINIYNLFYVLISFSLIAS